MTIVLSVLIGFCLDCLFGDPANLWHPICAIGKLISKTEALLRRIFPPTPNAFLVAGILLWFIVCGLSFLIPLIVLYLLSRIHPMPAYRGQRTWTLLCVRRPTIVQERYKHPCRHQQGTCGQRSDSRKRCLR